MSESTQKKRTNRQQSLIRLGLVIASLVLLNIVAYFFYGYFDLTDDKRYSLTNATEELVEDLDERVFVTVYLEGEFPAGFRRLQDGVRDILRKFRMLSGKVDYQFVDPTIGSVEERNKQAEQLRNMGLTPTRLAIKGNAENTEKYIYPAAVVRYKGRTMPVNLLENKSGVNPDIALNNSIRQLEYKFANALEKLMAAKQEFIVFLEGHGELSPIQTADMEQELQNHYYTTRINLDSITRINPLVDLLVVAKPTKPFSRKDKFTIDQFIMNGGRVVWLIDQVSGGLDSLRGKREHVPIDYQLNLDDLFFKYGFRVNKNMVLDLECSPLTLPVGGDANNPQFENFNWWYHPVVDPARNGHPMTKNLDRVEMRFPSSIDTVGTGSTNINKTVFLQSSVQSREQRIPVRVFFDILRYPPDEKVFNKTFNLGVLVEGEFESRYKNVVSQGIQDTLRQIGQEFKPKSEYNRMMVISDGDIIRNDVRMRQQGPSPMPLGYNEFAKYTFSNKEFLLNCFEYMLGKENLIEARSKELKLRMLNKSKAESERGKWQFINIGLPLIFLGIFGFAFTFIRKRRFAK